MLQSLRLWWLASGFLFGVSFVVPYLWWCIFPALVLLLFAIAREESNSKLFFWGIIVGTSLYAGSLLWCWDAFPVLWIPETNYLAQFSLIGMYWLTASLSMGIAIGIFALCIKKIKLHSIVFLIFVPILWLCSQTLASFFFSLYSLGPGSAPGLEFGFGYIGYLLVQSEFLISFAQIFGVYGLTYLGALLVTLLYIYIDKKLFENKIVNILILFCVGGLYVVLQFSTLEYSPNGQQVIAIETYFDRAFYTQINSSQYKKDALAEALSLSLSKNPDVIILPEDSRFTQNFSSPDELFTWIYERNEIFKGVIIDTGRIYDTDTKETVLRSYIYDIENTTVSSFDKMYLVPQGEFLPYLHGKVISLLVSKKVYEDVVTSLPYRKGKLQDSKNISSKLPAVLFCYESVSPFGVRKALSMRHPSFVAHVVSHSWFTTPASFWYQLDNMLKVQAVWNNVPIVSAGNMSPSKLYLPTGEIREGQKLAGEKLWSLKLFEL